MKDLATDEMISQILDGITHPKKEGILGIVQGFRDAKAALNILLNQAQKEGFDLGYEKAITKNVNQIIKKN